MIVYQYLLTEIVLKYFYKAKHDTCMFNNTGNDDILK